MTTEQSEQAGQGEQAEPPVPVEDQVPVADQPPAEASAEESAEVSAETPAPLPPMPEAPPAVGFEPVPPVKKDRRVLRAVLRWTAAVVVFAAVGTSAAYGITEMERTDVPGLATEADGRWEYPTISKPPLPSGSPGPFAEENTAGAHYADLRKLLLPAPKGAKADAALRGEDGWLPTKTFLAEYATKEERADVGQLLTDYGLRHIAARGWTTPDGTHTRVYLLQFGTAAVADEVVSNELMSYNTPVYAARGTELVSADPGFAEGAQVPDVTRYAYAETKPYGPEQVRQAYLSAADTIAVVLQSRKGTAKAVPFQQTVVLQSQLLD
ncbi:hypothetical protein ACFVYG_14900 [Streptomyces sp. NPDC058256]|uniref:hypothetical protein n=1 Tax=Streptomyces sp. NPDC058256 TaxID=3346408 RepID=UPI0036EBA897